VLRQRFTAEPGKFAQQQIVRHCLRKRFRKLKGRIEGCTSLAEVQR
jgi:hypothetical protein